MLTGRNILLFSFGLMVLAAAAGVYLMFWGPDSLEVEGKSLSQLLEGGELLTIGGVLVSLVIGGAVIWWTLRTIYPPEIKGGVTAPAKVLKVWDTGTTVNDNPQVGLLLEVTPAAGAPFRAETKTLVSRLQVALVQPGCAAEVKFDPQDTRRIRVLTVDTSTGASTTVARMEELNALRDKGLITEEEYRTKREEILRTL